MIDNSDLQDRNREYIKHIKATSQISSSDGSLRVGQSINNHFDRKDD